MFGSRKRAPDGAAWEEGRERYNDQHPGVPQRLTVEDLGRMLRDPKTQIAQVYMSGDGLFCVTGMATLMDGWGAFIVSVPAGACSWIAPGYMDHSERVLTR
jgi:hypothetical protein